MINSRNRSRATGEVTAIRRIDPIGKSGGLALVQHRFAEYFSNAYLRQYSVVFLRPFYGN